MDPRIELKFLNAGYVAATKSLDRVMRKWVKANAKRKTNSSGFAYSEMQSRRAKMRHESRMLHLVRGFMAGKPYKEIERSVREGNHVVPARLVYHFNRYGLDVDPQQVEEYLGW